ncbi:MAG TPA: acyl-CoA dehydrogenase family protein [Gemmatimonadales bacterium]|nr:acyl-CoA dehydrogenase family protein [Gemmatimonadales bacterium]
MDFSWSADQLALRRAVVDFAREELRDDLVARDADCVFSREHWRRCAEFGLQGLAFPEALGGGGTDMLTAVLALEGLGYGCRDHGLLFGLAAQMLSVQMPLLRFGTPEQQRRYLPRLLSGEWIGAHGMSEPDSGSDAFGLRTTARREAGHYVLDGTKTFVSNGPVADLFLVFATVDRAQGVLGVTAFLVERGFPGFRVGKEIKKMGLRTSPMSELVFEECRVPVENRLGREGRGAQIFNDSMEWERAGILAGAVGAMERQLEACVRYARERQQFGRPIGDFQAVAHRIADMKVRLEAARLLLYRAVWTKQARGEAGPEAAAAKLFLSDAWVRSCLDAVQLHGGYGFTVEYEVERDLRDAVGSTLYSGTSEIQRTLIARALGL